MLGHMPKRSAPELWYHLQSVAEQNLYDGAAGSGLVTDLVRAFNCLPREPIFHAAIQIGVPAEIARAWAAAVIGIKGFSGSVGSQVKEFEVVRDFQKAVPSQWPQWAYATW